MKIIDIDLKRWNHSDNLFYSKGWLGILEKEYGFNIKGVVVDGDGREEPMLLFAEVDDIFSKRIISLPFSDYTEPLVPGVEVLTRILAFLKDTYPHRSITLKYHGTLQEADLNGYKNIRQAVCHRIPLNTEVDEIWQRTSRAFKKGVRKAEKHGLKVVRCNTEKGLDHFHKMLTNLRKKKFQILPQPKNFYRLCFDSFKKTERGNIWLTLLNEKPIAAAVVLSCGRGMFDKMGVSDQSFLQFRPNNILLWEMMKFGGANGFDFLDMGLTQADKTGLMRYKDSLGGEKTPINYYRYLPESYDLEQEQKIKKLLSELTGILTLPGVPDEVVQKSAKLLYRLFC